jgi:hypothetical protein
MTDDIFFELDPYCSSPQTSGSAMSIAGKPKDDFTTPPPAQYTLFYLSVTTPHTDTHLFHGPYTSFSHLLPLVESIVSNSPSAIDKLDALRSIRDVWGAEEPNYEFASRGFGTFVVEGQKGVYTVLRVVREVNRSVYEELPSPVYVVTSHGPLTHANKGYVNMTQLVGAYVDLEEAREGADQAMRELVWGKQAVNRSGDWERGKGGGMLVAMTSMERWEVRIGYEDQVLKRAKEGLEREGENIGWRF